MELETTETMETRGFDILLNLSRIILGIQLVEHMLLFLYANDPAGYWWIGTNPWVMYLFTFSPVTTFLIALTSYSPQNSELRHRKFIVVPIGGAINQTLLIFGLLFAGGFGPMIIMGAFIHSLLMYRPIRGRVIDRVGGDSSISLTEDPIYLLLLLPSALVLDWFIYPGLGQFQSALGPLGIVLGYLPYIYTLYLLFLISSLFKTPLQDVRKRQHDRGFKKQIEDVSSRIPKLREIDALLEGSLSTSIPELQEEASEQRAMAASSLRKARDLAVAEAELERVERLEDEVSQIYNDLIRKSESLRSPDDEPRRPMLFDQQQVEAFRGCEVVGSTFEYKAKVVNTSDAVITNVTVTIVAYPNDCLEIAGEATKTISRIEVGGFRSPQFIFMPTKDCVEGDIIANVTYLDYTDRPHTLEIKPYRIRSVCDLLSPASMETQPFELILGDMTSSSEEQRLDWNPRALFKKAKLFLRTKNFYIVDADEQIASGQFIGAIRGLAAGKYTQKRIAAIIAISGSTEGSESLVKVEALGDDIAMLPTTIAELSEGISSWLCVDCGAPLRPEQVTSIKAGAKEECGFCLSKLYLERYQQ